MHRAQTPHTHTHTQKAHKQKTNTHTHTSARARARVIVRSTSSTLTHNLRLRIFGRCIISLFTPHPVLSREPENPWKKNNLLHYYYSSMRLLQSTLSGDNGQGFRLAQCETEWSCVKTRSPDLQFLIGSYMYVMLCAHYFVRNDCVSMLIMKFMACSL